MFGRNVPQASRLPSRFSNGWETVLIALLFSVLLCPLRAQDRATCLEKIEQAIEAYQKFLKSND